MGHAPHRLRAPAQLHATAQLHTREYIKNAKFNRQTTGIGGAHRGRHQSLRIDRTPIRVAHRFRKCDTLRNESIGWNFAEQAAADQIRRHNS